MSSVISLYGKRCKPSWGNRPALTLRNLRVTIVILGLWAAYEGPLRSHRWGNGMQNRTSQP